MVVPRPAHVAFARSAGCVALLILCCALSYGFLCQPGKTPYSAYSDALTYNLGAMEGLHRSLTQGAGPPFWQPYQMSGGPDLTNPQHFYALLAPFLALSPSAALGPEYFFSFLLAGLAFFAIGRSMGLGHLPAGVMGLAALYNGKVVLAAFAGWLALLPAVALAPLAALAAARVARRPTLGNGLLLAAAAALCLQSAHLQIVYYAGVACALALAAAALRGIAAGRARHVSRAAGALAAACIAALALSAYKIVPLLSELPLASRQQADYAFFLSHHATAPGQLVTFLFPEALGTPLDRSYAPVELWEDSAFFGYAPFLLALVGAASRSRRDLARPLALAFVLIVVCAMDTPLLHALWRWLPGMRMFRAPSRLLFIASFVGMALAGIGAEVLLSLARERRVRLGLAAVLALAVAVPGHRYARRYLGTTASEKALPEPGYAGLMAADPSLFRVAPFGSYVVNYGWAPHLGLQLVTGYDPYNLRSYGRYFDVMTTGSSRSNRAHVWFDIDTIARPDLLDALNVKYVLSPVALSEPKSLDLYAKLEHEPMFVFYRGMFRGPVYVYRNTRALERAFFVEQVVGAPDEDAAIHAIEQHSLEGLAVVEEADLAGASGAAAPGDAVQVDGAGNGRLALTVKAQRPRYLVVSEVWHPGWQATLDGQPLALHRTDATLVGALVPGGTHRIALEFRPLHWELARSASLVALAAVSAAASFAVARHLARRRA